MDKRNFIKFTLLITLALFLFISLSYAQDLTGFDIMQKAKQIDKPKDSAAELKMIITNKKGGERVREMQTFTKRNAETDLSKKLIIFLSPPDDKGTGFLSHENKDRDDDQWLYMPAQRKARRIAAQDKGQPFMGSDFSYSDLQGGDINKYTYNKLREEKFKDFDCYVVESIPKNLEDSQYSKTISWVRKDNFIPIKNEFYDKEGNLLKVMTVEKLEQVDNYWTPKITVMENVQKGSKTTLEIVKIKNNLNLEEDIFTERSFERPPQINF